MKKLVFLTMFLFGISYILKAQFANDYPFKTFVDDEGNLYVTGDTLINQTTSNILTKKFDAGGNLKWSKWLNLPNGKDKGMDITIDNENHDVFVTGYIFNNLTNKYRIITIKYDKTLGDTLWARRSDDYRESKGYGITLDNDNNIYVCGYITGEKDRKDFLAVKYDRFGNREWLNTTNFSKFLEDDITTDILVE